MAETVEVVEVGTLEDGPALPDDVTRALDDIHETSPALALVLDHLCTAIARIDDHAARTSGLVAAGEEFMAQMPKGGGMLGMLGPLAGLLR